MNYREFAETLFQRHPEYRVDLGRSRHAPPERVHAAIDAIVARYPEGAVRVAMAGRSFEGRSIRRISLGKGPLAVLLWSQMHGDEPTATAALVDILHYCSREFSSPEVKSILAALTIHMVPLLNPDGASRCTRRTAQQIDMNRDALAFATPEAAILKAVRDEIRPAFGYNLHDQELSTAGSSHVLTAVSLLAPAFDHEKNDNEVRRNARHLGSTFADILSLFVDGKIARYDDAFEPRAFGDNMQKWGTSTLLVESGHAKDDPEKESIRRLNVAGILSSLFALATGEYASSGTKYYDELPFNTKKAYDVICRNITAVGENGATFAADLGLSAQVDTHSEPPLRLVDIGDLKTFVGWREIDAKGKRIPQSKLLLGQPFDPLSI